MNLTSHTVKLCHLILFPLILARILNVDAQPLSIAPLSTQRPTNGPRIQRHDDPPARNIRGGTPIPKTIAPTPPSTSTAVIPTLSPDTHAPNAARKRPPSSIQHRGPTEPPRTDSPSSSPSIKNGGCFSGHTTVQVQGKGELEMKRLAIGDKVRDVTGKFVHVYSFGHYEPHAKGEYMMIYVQGHEEPLEITNDHLVFQDGKAVPASSIVAGNEIDLGLRTKGLVQRVTVATRQGLFAPYTTSGTLLVNHVAVSSYVTVQPDTAEFMLLGRYWTSLSSHWLSHLFLNPYRVLCSHVVGTNVCKQWELHHMGENYRENWAEATIAKHLALLNDKSSGSMTKLTALTFLVLWLLLALALYIVEVGWSYVLLLWFGSCFVLRCKLGDAQLPKRIRDE